ncbi:hypothetical protein NFHSH190041_26970 [Shewanella sp. NFH-SH190041]|uniref:fimbria/pilus periplasmic chaperone n=1 Tax=Shewanella sp. NFH-SH190041 TaxID=2950245 RepID=UPI0021C3F5EC|nr:fimbria/pilus periplasmic chaperone [Shewanella sp. NFH-SH190041]BDM65245.1 hypothetical protein NFHSH190041_26970 [Shewanella sp. NFH-SH190041]
MKLSILFLLLLVIVPSARAFQIQPMVQQMEALGKESNTSYRLENTGRSDVTVEVSAFRRFLDVKGKEHLQPADDDFLILPPQAVVAPGQFQVFRVKYMGQEDTSKSISYRVDFRQLPVVSELEDTGVKMLFNFSTLVFINPHDGKVEPKARLQWRNKLPHLLMTNHGTEVMVLGEWQLELRTKKARQQVLGELLRKTAPASFVMPGRTLIIPLEGELAQSISQAEIINVRKL